VETKNLDGETNLKTKVADKLVNKALLMRPDGHATGLQAQQEDHLQPQLVCDLNMERLLESNLTCEAPNELIYKFEGRFEFESQQVPLGPDHLLLRGSSLRNTSSVVGLITYTGHETKIMLNSANVRFKMSHVQQGVNQHIVFIFSVQCLLTFVGALVGMVMSMSGGKIDGIFYGDDSEVSHRGFQSFLYWTGILLQRFGTWILIFTNFVPISLLVTLEMVKFFQAYFISNDYRMVDEYTGVQAKVQASNLNEELGTVKVSANNYLSTSFQTKLAL